MKDRIKLVRESLLTDKGKKYSQAKLAEDMHVTRDVIANYEAGRVEPTSLFISTFCDKYGINEEWLRTGNGKMEKPLSREEEVARLANTMLDGVDSPIVIALMKTITNMDSEALARFCKGCGDFLQEVERQQGLVDAIVEVEGFEEDILINDVYVKEDIDKEEKRISAYADALRNKKETLE